MRVIIKVTELCEDRVANQNSELEMEIENAELFFKLDGSNIFKINCYEFQEAIDAFRIRSY